jgi:hypothetical protein
MSEWKSKMKAELESWGTRLDEAKLKTSLAKLEMRAKREELLHEFHRAHSKARTRLDELRASAGKEWDASVEALEAGWEALHGTYKRVKKDHDETSSK